MIGRRSVLLAPLALAACGVTAGGPVRVAVTWSDWELGRFRAVLNDFEARYGLPTEVVPLGDDISAVVGSRRGGAVDVVMLPQVWALEELWEQLEPLDQFVPPDQLPQAWHAFLTHGGRLRGIPFKVAHKSVVWYRKDLYEPLKEPPPRTWRAWLEVNRKLADRGIAPLALAGADGWTLADFFENVVLGLDDTTYPALADGKLSWGADRVVEAFTVVGEMWSQPGMLSGDPLLTQAESAVVDHLVSGRAVMVAGADFTYPVIARHDRQLPLDWFRFPRQSTKARAPKVGADVVVVPAPATEGALRLAEWLAKASAQRVWARDGGLLSVHREFENATYPTDRIAMLAGEVDVPDPVTGELMFDLADRLGAVGAGLRRVLPDFLRAVAGNEQRVPSEARAAATRMAQIAARSAR